jgi:hypothetical protein
LHKIIFYPLNLINYFKTSCSKGAMWELAPFFFFNGNREEGERGQEQWEGWKDLTEMGEGRNSVRGGRV